MGETRFGPRRTAAGRAAGAAAPAGTPSPARSPGAVPEHVRTYSRDAVVDTAARFTASSRSHRR